MHQRLRAILSLSAACCAPALAHAAEEKSSWTIDSADGVDFDRTTGIATITNGLTVRYQDGELIARNGRVNQKTGEVTAQGDVRLRRGTQVWMGEKIQYNFRTGRILGEHFKAGQPPFFASGDGLIADRTNNVYTLDGGRVTTDDVERPAYSLRAQSVVIVPGEYLEARGATLRLGSVPVFYFPYYKRSLKDHAPRWTFTPGYRSVHGPYLLTSYRWYWNEQLDGALHLDERVKRGLGFGPDFNYHLPRLGDGALQYYSLRDREPGRDANTNPIDPDRWRLYYSHQGDLRTNLSVKAAVRWQSDPRVIRDFFENEYRQNYQPGTFFEVNQRWPNFTLDVLARPRVNEFFETVERLPDVKLTGLRQQIFRTPLYYESESSVGYYRREFENNVTNRFGAVRADTYHQLLAPHTFFGFLNVTPRAGVRFTHYGETDGRGYALGDEDRGVFNTGGEVSFRTWHLWRGAENRFFQIDGLRHILEPSLNYAFVPRPNVPPPRLPQFDYELPTTRLRPIDFPDDNAIDSIDAQNVLRLGLRNKVQTKRREGVENFAHWALYTDWRLNPRPAQRTFADLYSDLDLKPFSWLTVNSELRYDLNRKDWNEANHTATFQPGDRWSLTLGQRFLRTTPAFGTNSGNNIWFNSLYFKLSENWGARATIHYEARDKVVEEQQYTIYRDFRAWTGALTFRVRDNRAGPIDYTAAFTFSLKAWPRFGLGADTVKPSLLLGE